MDNDIEARVRRSAAERARRQLDCVTGTVALAGALARAGREVDLRGLADELGALCAGIIDLAREDGQTFRPGLIGLMAQLDALQGALETRSA